jgi:threonine dehydratase
MRAFLLREHQKPAFLSFMMKAPIDQFYKEAEKARDVIYQAGEPTPLEHVQLENEKYDLFIKREDLGPIKAYKWRGGFNAVYNHHKNGGSDIVVAASAGNHAQGVALAARMLNLQAKIFMPLAAPMMKQKAVQYHGGENVELILEGDNYNAAGDAAKAYVKETGYTYIHPFDDIYTMAGQAMIADEIIKASDKPFDYAFLQIGGGGIAGATAAWLKKHWPDIKIIGVEGENQASMKASVEAGKPVTLDKVDTFCDGTAVTRPGDLTFEICAKFIDKFITVNNDEVSVAMRSLWDAKRLIPEPSGAMGVAGLQKYARENPNKLDGKKVLSIICGANMDFSKLSLVARKSGGGSEGYRRYYRIALPEKEGALLDVLNKCFQDVNVSEFMYGKIHESQAWQTIAIDGKDKDFDTLNECLKSHDLQFRDISHDTDIKYKIINYNPALFKDPLFLNIEFPERKGALRDLLRAISTHANICYFNYAYSGEAVGRALMGFEFSDTRNREEFTQILDNTIVSYSELDQDTVERILKH